MRAWKDDQELFSLAKSELFTAVVGDIMDKMRLFHQYLPAAIRPMRADMVLVGRAMPVVSVDAGEEMTACSANPLMAKPFGLMLEAVDALRTNDVYLNTGSSPRNALWGEMMTIRARKLGCAGA